MASPRADAAVAPAPGDDKSSAPTAPSDAVAPASPTSALASPGAVAFSSQPVAPVVASSHARRPSTDASASSNGAQSESNSSTNSANEHGSGSNGTASKSQEPNSSSRSSAARRTATPPSPYSSGSETESSDDERHKSKSKSSSRSSSQPKQSEDASSSGDSSNAPPPAASPGSAGASMSLPSISGATLLQLRGSGNAQALERISSIQPAEKRSDEAYDAPGAAPSRHFRRSRSRSRERPPPNNTNDNSSRWATGSDPTAAAPTARHERDAMPVGRGDDRPGYRGPSDDRDVRILFHGREIFPDDLIGLRVSKTFAGHGRFLGQVVKFDEPSLLYTVVYADGDAEELSIDNTLQILIQDEIERADPSLPPIPVAAVPPPSASPSYPPPPQTHPESPSVHNGMTPSSSMHPQRQPQGHLSMAPGAGPPPPPTASGAAPAPQRSAIQISEREAQFVVSLFENHALPTLLRDGWKVRTSASGTETRFAAPPGNFSGPGRVFPSPLAVVEFIASDRELLAACFPPNVHAAILSLFPDATARARESSRKRNGPGESNPYDLKRQRSGRDELSGAAAAGASHMRSGPPPHQQQPQRHGGAYSPGDDRDVYTPIGPGGRFSSSSSGGPPSSSVRDSSRSGVRSHHHVEASEYRRIASDSRSSAPVRISSESNASASRWTGSNGSGMRASPVDMTEYRRQYASSPEWREHDMPPPRRQSYASESSQMAYHDGPPVYRTHSRADDMPPPPYYSDHSGMRAPMGDAPHRRALPPGHDPAAMAQQQAPPGPSSRGPPFSMVDVDRNVHPRSGALSPSEQQQWDSRRKASDRSAYDHTSSASGSSSHHHHRRHQQHSYTDAPSAGRMSEPPRASSPSGASASTMSH